MKHIKSSFRALCLVALLCMTSGNAMAYKFFSGGEISPENGCWGDNKILIVDGGPYVMEVFETIDYGYPLAIVITKGTTVTVTMDFRNEKSGTIYVFGTLNVKESDSQLNEGNIYVMEGGSLNGEITYNSGNIKYECSMSGILTSHEIKGKAPAKNEDGWKDFYVKDAIFCENDYYPIPNTTTYYTDATMETSIPDLEYWKQHDGKLEYSLDYLKTEAINAINEARKGLLYVESYYKQVEKCIDLIKRFYLDPEQGIEYAITEIDRIKSMAFVYIKDWISEIALIEARDGAINAINEAMKGLSYIESYYEKVEEYIAQIEGINFDCYTVEDAINAIETLKSKALGVIEEWKSAIIPLIEARNGAIKEINDAMHDVVVYYPDCEKEVEEYISLIQQYISLYDINGVKDQALAKIEKIREIANSVYKYYMGTFIKKQAGPAVKVTKGDDTIILYGPDKVEFIKAETEK